MSLLINNIQYDEAIKGDIVSWAFKGIVSQELERYEVPIKKVGIVRL
jgi:hypothetical protein